MKNNEEKGFIQIVINELVIDVDIRILLILSNLAQIDPEYTAGPKAVVEAKVVSKIGDNDLEI